MPEQVWVDPLVEPAPVRMTFDHVQNDRGGEVLLVTVGSAAQINVEILRVRVLRSAPDVTLQSPDQLRRQRDQAVVLTLAGDLEKRAVVTQYHALGGQGAQLADPHPGVG